MCTLSFVPQLNSGYLLTSNRDEAVARMPALPPSTYVHGGIEVVYPKDTQAGGTWLASAKNGYSLCLLNGAYVKHKHNPTYKHSRGLVVLDFFKFNNIDGFLTAYDFSNIEPFTLVIIDGNRSQIQEIRWDGTIPNSTAKDWNKPHIWSSATLYEPSVIEQREQWFFDFLALNPNADLNQLLHFHHFGGNDTSESNRLLMNRNNILKTISITGIKKCMLQTMMHYEDLIENKTATLQISQGA